MSIHSKTWLAMNVSPTIFFTLIARLP